MLIHCCALSHTAVSESIRCCVLTSLDLEANAETEQYCSLSYCNTYGSENQPTMLGLSFLLSLYRVVLSVANG